MLRKFLLGLLLTTFIALPAQNQTNVIAIVGATVIDGTGAAPIKATVIVQGDRIAAVGANVEVPAGARIINAEGQTLLPGLFDLHTHLFNSATGAGTPDWAKHMKTYLYCGVTSIVDLSPYPEMYEPIRRLLKTGIIAGPRVSLAARMTTPGGHGAEGGRGEIHTQEISTPREAIAAVQHVVPYRPDVIKVFSDGWRYGAASDMTSINEDALTAIVEEAHKTGIEVVTHTVTLERAKIAARAGVDAIIHGIGNAEADKELIQLMKAHNTFYAPTLSVYERKDPNNNSPLLKAVLEQSKPESTSALPIAPTAAPANPAQTPQAKRWEKLMHNTAAMKKGGVTFGNGTDAGMPSTYHGWATLHELQLLVAGGLTPLEAITAATGNSAKALKVDNERGTIAAGKLADLVLVEGSPQQNISDIERIKSVFLGGREVDREQLSRDITTPKQTPLPSLKASELIDDFESENGRSRMDTLWLYATDPSHDHSKVIFGRTSRETGNHALSAMAQMSVQARPFVRMNIPLSRAALEPVDVRAFRGVRFDVRGEGAYRLVVPTREVRTAAAYFQAPFQASAKWETVNIDFASLKSEGARAASVWTGEDVLMLSFEIARKAGEVGWLELDNIRFFK
ncbi:MAG: CIA30 family protein [Acidobacteria bacterium]|nr:CIA30 family protein [Acidobacteriota bacterium]